MKSLAVSISLGILICVVFLSARLLSAEVELAGPVDARDIRTGPQIPDESYCDQPYVVVTRDGNWLCTLTTGKLREGLRGQHVVSTISTDRGKTWSKLVDIEPADGPEASWVVPLVTPGGRVYAFYTYNGDDVSTLRGKKIRADMLGWYCYRYSDDNGKSWSRKRYRLPMRVTACDRTNDWKGKVIPFWGICKPITADGKAYFSFTKLGRYMLDQGEGWLYRSDNILIENDVTQIRWELLPDGEHGIRASRFGSVQEEHNLVSLGDGRLYCVYRTKMGYPCHTYSTDGGRTWLKPEPMTYTPGGKIIKTPRACPKVWKTGNGKYLFWYHNNGLQDWNGRNPVWLAGGVEIDGMVHWSQPEIVLYDPNDVSTRISYPDLIEQNGRYWITETNKTTARVHEIDAAMLEGMWNQGRAKTVAQKGLVLDAEQLGAKTVRVPQSLDVAKTGGLSIGFWIRFGSLVGGQVILDNRDADGRGITLTTTAAGTVRLDLNDGKNEGSWDCDMGRLTTGPLHHVVAIVDDGPRIITFVVDGVLCDGGTSRRFGWGRYSGNLGDVSGTHRFRVAPSLKGKLFRLRVYNRYLRTSEAIGNRHAGPRAGRPGE